MMVVLWPDGPVILHVLANFCVSCPLMCLNWPLMQLAFVSKGTVVVRYVMSFLQGGLGIPWCRPMFSLSLVVVV